MSKVQASERGLPQMLVVIVNYRTGPLVVDCLQSLQDEVRAMPELRAIVVDNASGDLSSTIIELAIRERGWSDWAGLIDAPSNGGFAYGNNRAIELSFRWENPPDLIWLLNPDTIVRPGAARSMAEFMQSHGQVGIAGTSIERENGVLWPFAFRFPTILSEVERGARLRLVSRALSSYSVFRQMTSQAEVVDWVSGASMVVRREVFEDIGLMDEAYFLYCEETDFCLQARRSGWECWYVPQARVMHIAGQSTGVTGTQAVVRRLPRYWFESRRRYFVKNHGRLYAIVADIAWATMHVLWLARKVAARQPNEDPPMLLGDFLRYSAIFSSATDPADARSRAHIC